ncbi:hypothetical protein [Rhizobium sp. AU243]|uniref:hypothetical protein n=1 Tax=Rhizobium sp. AU243 TaxID=2303425 RepID=UPI0010CC3E40|nr:hypothetical protein [Rhizobium sp. AU243]
MATGTLRETSEAKPVLGQTHANRDRGWSARFRKSGEYDNSDRPYASSLKNGNGAGFAAMLYGLIFTVMARQSPSLGVTDAWPCFRSPAGLIASGDAEKSARETQRECLGSPCRSGFSGASLLPAV